MLLGVDGGGTSCRARLAATDGTILAESVGGPANLRLGLERSLRVVRDCTRQCLLQSRCAGQGQDIVACLALAGASEPDNLTAAQQVRYPFRSTLITTDAQAACVGAHGGADGGIVIAGTGSVGWGMVERQEHRVGGWGFPLSDQGSGAWIGFTALKQLLLARDGVTGWTGLLRCLFERFDDNAHAVVRWMDEAQPGDYAALAPTVVSYALRGDVIAVAVMSRAAEHIEAIAARLEDLGVPRLCLMGGLAGNIEPFLSPRRRAALSAPLGDALTGALRLAGLEAERLAASHNRGRTT
jgi:glucosamine kinase